MGCRGSLRDPPRSPDFFSLLQVDLEEKIILYIFEVEGGVRLSFTGKRPRDQVEKWKGGEGNQFSGNFIHPWRGQSRDVLLSESDVITR